MNSNKINRVKDSYHPYAMITIFCWSLAYVFTRLMLKYFSALSLGFLRYVVASVVLIIFSIIMRIKPPQKKDWLWFVLSGLSGFSLYIMIFNVGTSFVSAATSSVVIAIVPVLTAILASILFREKLRRNQWISIVIEFVGIVILTLSDGVFVVNVGILWLLLAAMLLSLYNILQRRLTRTYPAFQSTTYSIIIGTLLLTVFAPMSIKEVSNAPITPLIFILILGVFSSAVAYVCWSKAFEKAEKTSSVSNYMFFTPLLTSILGFFIAKEIPSPSTLIGGVVILLGAFAFNRSIS